MADKYITDLTETSEIANDDLMVIHDLSEVSTEKVKKVQNF